MNYYYHLQPQYHSVLTGEESSHAIKVLRKKEGDIIYLMDGKGGKYKAQITKANFRKCEFKVIDQSQEPTRKNLIHVAIAPTKSVDRLEWFVEKACELGTDFITIISTQRTERKKINLERLEKKTVSAMKQSKNFWKCQINGLIDFKEFLAGQEDHWKEKYIAYVETGRESSMNKLLKPDQNTIILVGPEGDFSTEEVTMAQKKGFVPVNLGNSILRTETAGVIAVHTYNLVNDL